MLRIMHVDDAPPVRRLVQRGLELRGHTVIATSDVEDARAKLKTEDVDVLILDMHLPSGIGLDLVSEVRSSKPSVRVLIASGDQDAEMVRRSLEAGAEAYLSKPLNIDELAAILEI